MSGLDKIIEHIENSATETAEKMIESARTDAERIVSDGRERVREREEALRKQNQAEIEAAARRIESAADMTQKRIILETKQKEIENVISIALEELRDLDDNEYFETILRMIGRYAINAEGKIRFSQKDLDRLPAGFEKKIGGAVTNGGKLSISPEAVKIDGGFILDYGDIEENCSFEALIEGSKEELQDKISQILFN